MRKINLRRKILLLLGVLVPAVFILIMFGCGQVGKNTMGGIAPKEKQPRGGNLYEKYKDQFPENLMELTPEYYMSQWPNNGFILQSADGTKKINVYSTVEVFKNILVKVENSYPEFDAEKYANAEVKKLIESDSIANSTQILYKEQEKKLKEFVVKKLQEKSQRIAAEQRYIAFQEIISPEKQNKIASQISAIQMRVNNNPAVANDLDFEYDGKFILSEKQIALLLAGFFLSNINAVTAIAAGVTVPLKTLEAMQHSENYTKSNISKLGGDMKGNAFKHAYWTALTGKVWDGIPYATVDIAKWWAYEFTSAREKENDESAKMDFHNDQVGANIYREHARNHENWIRIRIGWVSINILIYWTPGSASREGYANILKTKMNEAMYVDWKNNQWKDGATEQVVNPDGNTLIYTEK